MSLLLDRLPDAVIIGGQSVPIRTDFRYSILFEMLCLDNSLSSAQKSEQALRLMYPALSVLPLNEPQQIVDGLLWFFRGGDRPRNRHQIAQQHRQSDAPTERVYDYNYDDELIYAAFLQQYGIDLTSAHLHWWQYRALFSALSEETKFMRVLGYRTAKITQNMSKEEKRHLRRMKEIYALPVSLDEAAKEAAIAEALQSGNAEAVMALLRGGEENV